MGTFSDFREVINALKHKKINKKTIKVCPKCRSKQIIISSGLDTYPRMYGITPTKYICSECDYSGSIILEQKEEETGQSGK
jgi:hypothetical protein